MDDPPGNAANVENGAFGTRLRHAREAAGLAQEDLATRAGLSPNTVGGLERGEHRHPYPATVRALATALGLDDAAQAALVASLPARNHLTDRASTPATVAMPSGLPAPLTPLFGREAEITWSADLVRGGVRLVTLTGPGGVGKTALALRIAGDLAPAFPHGAVFVSLAPVRDPDLVAPTVARALGIGERGDRVPVDRLRDALRDRHTLLVLDNLEHVLDAVPLITELLTWCPQLAILATSRVALRLAGEQLFPVPPLTVPDPEHLPARVDLAGISAVQLFVTRAQGVDPSFALTDANAGAVAAICHRLEGLPLALELAAAQSAVLTPAALLPLLARRLPLLTGGRRDAPARQRTLRDAIAWSFDLLTPDEQRLFRRLGAFVGGFSLDAAQAVAGDDTDVLTDVSALVTASLVNPTTGAGDEPRFTMLETIREFALERLNEAGETGTTRDAHAAWFAALDEKLEPNRLAPGEQLDDRLLRIEADTANYREALAHLAATGDAEGALRLAGALAVFWQHRGHLREGRSWLEWALARTAGAAPTIWCGRGLAGLSLILWAQGEPDRAAPLAESARAIAEDLDDPELRALAIHLLGMVARAHGRLDQAEELMTEALRLERAIGTPGYGATALVVLSGIAQERGDRATSVRRAEEALSLFQAVGHAAGIARVHCTLAGLAAERGDDRAALAGYQEALRCWAGIGERFMIAAAFSGLAALAAGHGQPEQAATLVGVIDTRLEESGAGPWLSDRPRYDWATATAEAALGAARFAALREAGRALPFAAAVAAVAAGMVVTVPESPIGPSTITVSHSYPIS